MKSFCGRYTITDGYVGHRPIGFSIAAEDVPSGLSDSELEQFYLDTMCEDFESSVFPEPELVEHFVDWARKLHDEENDGE